MLGNAVFKYFQTHGYQVVTTNYRWPETSFEEEIKNFTGDFIINCIGAFPNRGSSDNDIHQINFELPFWISKNSEAKLILPATDGEYSGNIAKEAYYDYSHHMDSAEVYGKSKAQLFTALKTNNKVRFIRTSIIGIEKNTANSLLSWFLNLPVLSKVNGYVNVLWNGITTLEWAKTAEKLASDWDAKNEDLNLHFNLVQIGSEKISKYELLTIFNDVYERNIVVCKTEAPTGINRCLYPYNKTKPIKNQLYELKQFYGL